MSSLHFFWDGMLVGNEISQAGIGQPWNALPIVSWSSMLTFNSITLIALGETTYKFSNPRGTKDEHGPARKLGQYAAKSSVLAITGKEKIFFIKIDNSILLRS